MEWKFQDILRKDGESPEIRTGAAWQETVCRRQPCRGRAEGMAVTETPMAGVLHGLRGNGVWDEKEIAD